MPIFADPPQPVVVNAVTDQYRPLPFDQEKLSGLFAKRMRANSEGFLEHIDDQLSVRSPEPDSEHAGGAGLSGQAGKLLDAAASAYEYHRDEHLRAVMVRIAKQVIAAEATARHSVTQAGEDVSGDQDLLTQKYDLLGLLAYYHVSQDEDALDAAAKIGLTLFKSFPKGSVDRRSTVVIEPLVNLYRYTEENRYLELCRSAADAWLHAKETHNDPTAENLSDLQGLIELYRVTGDESYFRPVPAAWMQIRNKSLSLTGNPQSNGEESAGGNNKDAADACATLAWMRLTLDLLRITGEPQYADQLERTIYNQLFASQDGNTGAISPAPLNGSKQAVSSSDPCASDEAQGLTMIPAAVWGRYGNGIAVLLYSSGRGTFQLRRRGAVQLYSEAVFPESGDFLLHVEPAHNIRFPLRLRVPEWTNKFTVDVAGSHLLGKPGEFLTINREWKPGDTVKVSIDMTVRMVVGSGEYADDIAVERGPQVLALAHLFNPQMKDLADAAIIAADASQPHLLPASARLPPNWPGDQAYTIAGEYGGKPQNFVLVPFADAKSYRVWLKRPSASTGATN